MKLKILILAVVLIAIAGIIWLINFYISPAPKIVDNDQIFIENDIQLQDEAVVSEINLPWIEVVSSPVVKKSGVEWIDIKSGDQLINGDIVKTNASGLANIYMPDGSVARLDHDSEIVISQVDFDADNKSLKVQIKLIAGRIWSKIGELITSESYWEVETANAVASVRGTAFGVEYENGETLIIGWENIVEVEIIDVYSGRQLDKAIVASNKILRVNDAVAKVIVGERDVLSSSVEDLPLEIEILPWIQRSINADSALFGEKYNMELDEDDEEYLFRNAQESEDQNDSIELLDINTLEVNQR